MIVRQQPAWLTLALLVAMNTTACGPSIEDLDLEDDGTVSDDSGADDPGTDDTGTGDTDTEDTGNGADNGLTELAIDATDAEAWQYLELATGALVGEDDDWSLAFKRFDVKVNGGVSGDGGVEVAWVDAALSLDAQAPATGWVTDEADADEDGEPEYALADWYDYDVSTHTLSPAAGSCFVRGVDGVTYALAFRDYYDDAGTSGFPTIAFGEVEDPSRPVVATFDASSREDTVYVQLEGLIEIDAPTEPDTSLAWDLALTRTAIRTNGGWSGSGDGAVYTFEDGTTWDEVTTAPTQGWEQDIEPPGERDNGVAMNTWYDYDHATFSVSPSGRIHAVRDAAGDAWKLTVTDWDDGILTFMVAPLEAP